METVRKTLMKIGIMQPYLFPYIGYFQLIHAVDVFVLHDDVQYIKGGWINRNRIQVNKKEYLFTFSLKKDSSLKNINTRQFSGLFEKEKVRFLRTLRNSYGKAPNFTDTMNVIEKVFDTDEKNISPFIFHSLQVICTYVHIKTPVVMSSELKKDNSLKNQDRVINICQTLKGSVYINPTGGRLLYSKDVFRAHKISLFFLETQEVEAKDRYDGYIPNLSIIDVMMYYSPEKIRSLLKNYMLL